MSRPKETYYISKETYYMSKETYHMRSKAVELYGTLVGLKSKQTLKSK